MSDVEKIVISGIAAKIYGFESIEDYFRALAQGRTATVQTAVRWRRPIARKADTTAHDDFSELPLKAILDSGVNPSALRGASTIGVYSYVAENEEESTSPLHSKLVSAALQVSGPSVNVDSAGLGCLHVALQAIRKGECNSALAIAVTSERDDKTGIKKESAVVVYLTTLRRAKRVYAEVIETALDCGNDAENVERSSLESLKDFNEHAHVGVEPTKVALLVQHHLKPLGEPSNPKFGDDSLPGLLTLLITLLSHLEGIVPPSSTTTSFMLRVDEHNMLLKRVEQKQQWPGNVVGVSETSPGLLSHAILNFEGILAQPRIFSSSIPILVPFAARSRESLNQFFAKLKKTPELDQGTVALVHNIIKEPMARCVYRGYALNHHWNRGKNELALNTVPTDINKSPNVLLVLTGMGSQWEGMGRGLMKIPAFSESIARADAMLGGKLELKRLIESGELGSDKFFAPLMVTCIQLALVDVLRTLNIQPTVIVGHSMGEIASAYADGCLEFEQTVELASARADSLRDADLRGGSMASIGISWEEALKQCPPTVVPACHNAANNVTVSGPAQEVGHFVNSLSNQGTFASEVNTDGIAYHSEFVEPAKIKFEQRLKDIFGDAKFTPKACISSSVQEPSLARGKETRVVDYFVRNLRSPVHFKEALDLVPADALVIEAGPHSLLQGLLKKKFKPDRVHGLTNKTSDDHEMHLLQTIGKIYNAGVDLNLGQLYPVRFPLKCKIPPLSSSLK